jgi:F0F1-type ATP synthase assembly protein I
MNKYKDLFLMSLSVFICIAIIANAVRNNDAGMVRDLMGVLAFWMPSPIAIGNNNNTDKGL